MKIFIAQFLVWLRMLMSPTMVIMIWNAVKDGEVDNIELSGIIKTTKFSIKVPFITMFKSQS